MGGSSVLWAEAPNDDGDEPETQGHGAVDDSFAVRRLRRWLRGMFGGTRQPADEPPEEERES